MGLFPPLPQEVVDFKVLRREFCRTILTIQIPRTCLSSILVLHPLTRKFFPIKTVVMWVPETKILYIYIHTRSPSPEQKIWFLPGQCTHLNPCSYVNLLVPGGARPSPSSYSASYVPAWDCLLVFNMPQKNFKNASNCKPCQYVYIIMYQIAMYQLYLHKHTNTTCLKNKHKHTNMYTNYIYIQMKYIWTNVWYTNVSYRQQGAQILAWRAANEEVDTQQGWCHGVPFVADKTPSFLLWEDRDTWEQMANIWVSLLDVSSLLLINFHGEHMSQADGNLSLRFL